jgi:hypothetical protein
VTGGWAGTIAHHRKEHDMTAVAVRYAPKQGGIQVQNFQNATNEDIMAVAPAVFAENGHADRTKASYQFVSTIQLIEAMRVEGWRVTTAGQKFVRDVSRWGHAKHYIRMRHESADPKAEIQPEAIIMNAHDGTASWKYFDGAFRGVCLNGLVWGEIMGSVKAHHTMRQAGERGTMAITLSRALMAALPEKMTIAERMKEATLTEAQTLDYFTRAIKARWPRGTGMLINQDLMQAPWLKEDFALTAWQVYNHAQRWLVTIGGVQGADAAGRVRMTTPIRRVDELATVNVALWEEMMKTVPALEVELRKPVLEPELVQ